MLRSVAGRERRALWATLSFAFVVGIGATVYLSNADRNQTIARAAKDSRNAHQALRQGLKEAEARAQAAELRAKELEAELDRVTFIAKSGQ